MKNLIYSSKYNLLKSGSRAALSSLRNNEQLSREEIDVLRWKKLQTVVCHAKESSIYYRERYVNFDLTMDQSVFKDAFPQLPILKRADVRGCGDKIFCGKDALSSYNKITTGGSTGEPVAVLHPRRIPRIAALWRMMDWWGVPIGSDIATIYREPATNFRRRILDQIVRWPQRRILLDASHLSEAGINNWLERCAAIRPPIIHGYVGGVLHVARHILKYRRKSWKPTCVWVTSAPLTSGVKSQIEDAFEAPVFDQYGCCEIFYLAAETPFAPGLAVFDDLRHVEVVDEDNRPVPDGVEGRILVTDLENYDFPLIRYELGDRGRYLPNQINWKLPFRRMAPIKGRQSDNLTFPNGQTVSGEFWTTLFDEFPYAVEKFQIVQKTDNTILLRYVSKTPVPSEVNIVRDRISKLLMASVNVELERVSEIASDRGKIRYILREKL